MQRRTANSTQWADPMHTKRELAGVASIELAQVALAVAVVAVGRTEGALEVAVAVVGASGALAEEWAPSMM
jgi:hypothetical protein